MRFFLAVLLAIPLASTAADMSLERKLGTFYGFSVNGAPLHIELHEERGEFDTRLNVGAVVTPRSNLSISLGVSARVTLDGPASGPGVFENSDAMRAFYKSRLKKLTTLESDDWSLGGALRRMRPEVDVRYHINRRKRELVQIKTEENPFGKRRIELNYKWEFDWTQLF